MVNALAAVGGRVAVTIKGRRFLGTIKAVAPEPYGGYFVEYDGAADEGGYWIGANDKSLVVL